MRLPLLPLLFAPTLSACPHSSLKAQETLRTDENGIWDVVDGIKTAVLENEWESLNREVAKVNPEDLSLRFSIPLEKEELGRCDLNWLAGKSAVNLQVTPPQPEQCRITFKKGHRWQTLGVKDGVFVMQSLGENFSDCTTEQALGNTWVVKCNSGEEIWSNALVEAIRTTCFELQNHLAGEDPC